MEMEAVDTTELMINQEPHQTLWLLTRQLKRICHCPECMHYIANKMQTIYYGGLTTV